MAENSLAEERGLSRAFDSGKPEKNLQGQGIHRSQT